MPDRRRVPGLGAAQAGALLVVAARLARGRRRRPPLRAPAERAAVGVSVVVPARDEAERIGPCLAGLAQDPDVGELLVVDDGSTDDTGGLAARAGARVIAAGPPPPGWVGKPWALQRGLEEATGEVVVSLDADTRPRPGLVGALAAALQDADCVTAGARFVCDTPGERWLHPALLATLVYRFGPPDTEALARPSRLVVNGQCTAVRRAALLAAGGYRAAAGHLTDDAAFGRDLARRGWRIAFRDAGDLLRVDMHDGLGETWREWGRSIAFPGLTTVPWQAADVLVVWLTLGLPVVRAVAGRATRGDAVAGALRLATLAALAGSYERRGIAFWLSPLADPVAAVRLTASVLRPARRWRGRTYPAAARAGAPWTS